MKIKNINLSNLREIDIKVFYFLKSLFLKNRLIIYFFLFLIVLIKILLRIPYLNIFINAHEDIINATLIPLLLAAVLEFNGQKLIIISVALFLPLAFLSLVGQDTNSEQLANVIYGLLSIGILVLIVKYVKGKNA